MKTIKSKGRRKGKGRRRRKKEGKQVTQTHKFVVR